MSWTISPYLYNTQTEEKNAKKCDFFRICSIYSLQLFQPLLGKELPKDRRWFIQFPFPSHSRSQVRPAAVAHYMGYWTCTTLYYTTPHYTTIHYCSVTIASFRGLLLSDISIDAAYLPSATFNTVTPALTDIIVFLKSWNKYCNLKISHKRCKRK